MRWLICFLLLSLLLIPCAYADAAMLQFSSNSFLEGDYEVSYNLENKDNATYFFDFSWHGRHLWEETTAGETNLGKYGDAYEWLGMQRLLNGTDLDIGTTQDFSVEFWIYPLSLADHREILLLGSSLRSYIFSTGKVEINFGDIVDSNSALGVNCWTHVAFVYDYTDATHMRKEIFLNGTSDAVDTTNYVESFDGLWWLGEKYTYAPYHRLDEFRIYKGVLSQPQIQADMNRPIEAPLTITGLTESDIVQLWYNGTHLYQQNTIGVGETNTTFNVFDFSDKTSPYQAMIKIYHEDTQYESPVLVLYWGDIYTFRLVSMWEDFFVQLLFGSGGMIGLLIISTAAFLVTAKEKLAAIIFVPFLIIMGIMYMENVQVTSLFFWSALLAFIEASALMIQVGLRKRR